MNRTSRFLAVALAIFFVGALLSAANAGLVGHWTFDDVSGDQVPDSAGGDDTGTLVGGTSIAASDAPVPGGTTSAARFVGAQSGQIINIVDTGNLAPGAGDWSYATWFNTVTVAPGVDAERQEFYGEYGLSPNVIQIYLTADEVTAYWRDGSGTEVLFETEEADVTPDVWHHLAFVRQENMFKAYLDAAPVGELDMGEILEFDTTGGNVPMMGAHPLHTGYWSFQGLLDDVRVYNHALSESEVETLAGGGSGPIPGDANLDNKVTDADAAILATNWQKTGATWSMGDFNNDQMVTDADAAILATHWQQGTEAAQPVPEPVTLVLLAAGIATMLLVRRVRNQLPL